MYHSGDKKKKPQKVKVQLTNFIHFLESIYLIPINEDSKTQKNLVPKEFSLIQGLCCPRYSEQMYCSEGER
jgi:hypothetical protein